MQRPSLEDTPWRSKNEHRNRFAQLENSLQKLDRNREWGSMTPTKERGPRVRERGKQGTKPAKRTKKGFFASQEEKVPSNWNVFELQAVTFDMEGSRGCAICLEQFRVGDQSITTHCGHIFHFNCMNNWYSVCTCTKFDCPCCKQSLLRQ
jgi:hypothetical protein